MSGNKIVPLLEKHKDVFVHGGAVQRHKQSYVEERKKIPIDGATELVLCAAATFKLWQPKPKAVPQQPSENSEGSSAPPPPPQTQPRPQLVWRQPHCYIKAVVPLAGDTAAFQFGFAIQYFAPQKETARKPDADLTEYSRNLRQQSNFITSQGSIDHVSPPLRVREYRCNSEYEMEDWCLAYKTTLFNYWHERLESNIIPAPEIFQFQCFAVDVSKHPAVDSPSSHTPLKAPVVQIALSTEKMYVIPRHDQASIERDVVAKVISIPVGSISSVTVYPQRGYRFELVSSFGASLKVSCFTGAEGSQLIVEIQRIWELLRKDDAFPYSLKE